MVLDAFDIDETNNSNLGCRVPDRASHRRLRDRRVGQALPHSLHHRPHGRRIDPELVPFTPALTA